MVTFKTYDPVWRVVVTEGEGMVRLEVFDSTGLIAFEQRKEEQCK